jgi:hypothetical protein
MRCPFVPVLIDLKMKRLQKRYKGSQLLKLLANEPRWPPVLTTSQGRQTLQSSTFVRLGREDTECGIFLRGRQQAIRPSLSFTADPSPPWTSTRLRHLPSVGEPPATILRRCPSGSRRQPITALVPLLILPVTGCPYDAQANRQTRQGRSTIP